MSFNTAVGRVEYLASSGQSDFDFVFKIYEADDILVWLTPVGQDPDDIGDLLSHVSDYTIVINGDNGGVLSLTSPSAAGDALTFVRSLDPKRFVEYSENGDLRPSILNSDQNYQTYLISDSFTAFDKVVRLPQNAQEISGELPSPVPSAYLRWAADAKSLENDTSIPDAVYQAGDSNLEAGSWANEDEDIKVKEYTNGVESDRIPSVYSAKHWAMKAYKWVISAYEFDDSLLKIYNVADNTKKIAFDASNITASTTRMIIMPDEDVELVNAYSKAQSDAMALEIASTGEVVEGTDNIKYITPLRMKEGFNASGAAPLFATRAWVNYSNFNILGSGNVSSVADISLGVVKANFITAVEDNQYEFSGSASGASGISLPFSGAIFTPTTPLAQSIEFNTLLHSGGLFDAIYYSSISIRR